MEKEDEISEEKDVKIETQKNENTENETKKETELQENLEKEEKIEVKEESKEELSKDTEKLNSENKKSNKKLFIIIPIVIIILLFISTFFAIINMNNKNIVKGVYIEEIDISNQSKEKITEIINEKILEIENVELAYNDYNEIIKLEDLGIEISAKDAINDAITIGKSENILIDNCLVIQIRSLILQSLQSHGL